MINNNYTEAMKTISNSDFTLKGLKTFMGMDCPGINASLYYKGKKVAFLIDEGNGGCLNVEWKIECVNDRPTVPAAVKEAKIAMEDLINSLPKVTWEEVSEASSNDYGCDGTYDINEETFCNELIDNALKVKEFKKLIKKISVLTVNNEIASYKAKADQLDSMITVNGKESTFRNFVNGESDIKLILNDLPTDEAFALYKQYV